MVIYKREISSYARTDGGLEGYREKEKKYIYMCVFVCETERDREREKGASESEQDNGSCPLCFRAIVKFTSLDEVYSPSTR